MNKSDELYKETLARYRVKLGLDIGEGFSWSQISEAKDGKKMDKVKMLLISPDMYGIGVGGELGFNHIIFFLH